MIPTRRAMFRDVEQFAKPNDFVGAALVISDFLLWAAAVFGSLYFDGFGWRLLCGVYAGIKLGNLLVLAHDVAHEALVESKMLNRLLTPLCFIPCLHNFTLWILDHHGLHHPRCNGPHKGTYTPYSKAQFDRLPMMRRLLERFYRSGFPLGLGVHYAKERWLHSLFMPWKSVSIPENRKNQAYDDALFLALSSMAYLSAALGLGSMFGHDVLETIVTAVLVPYGVFFTLVGFVEFAQHTHPDVAWFQDERESQYFYHSELVSVHLQTPRWFGLLMHDVLDHPVHHLHAKVPCYKLRMAQAHLNSLLGEHAVTEKLSLRWFMNTMNRCKLYDFENNCWVGFDGRSASGSTRLYRKSIAELDQEELSSRLEPQNA